MRGTGANRGRAVRRAVGYAGAAVAAAALAPATAVADDRCDALEPSSAPIVSDPDGNGTRPPVRFFSDIRIPSNGMMLRASLYLPLSASAGAPVPAVVMTHGGGGTRRDLDPRPKPAGALPSTADGPGNKDLFGVVDGLLTRDYAVLSWDTRGQGQSVSASDPVFGPVRYHASHPDLEGADARALVDFLARCPWIRRDADDGRDPTVGFTGASNGGLQALVAGAADDRIDAIAPYEASADVDLDFLPNGVAKEWWRIVYRDVWDYAAPWFAGSKWDLDEAKVRAAVADVFHTEFPKIFDTQDEGGPVVPGSGLLTPALRAFLREVSVLRRVSRIVAPTLIVQGTTDTGAPLDTAYRLYDAMKEAAPDTPIKVVAACFGHRPCPYLEYESRRAEHAWRWQRFIFDWMDRHLKGVVGPPEPEFVWEDQDETYRTARGNPRTGHRLSVEGQPMRDSATYTDRRLVWDGTSTTGGDTAVRAAYAPLADQLAYRAGNWLLLPAPPLPTATQPSTCRPLVGIPRLHVTGTARRADGGPLTDDGRAFLFAELLDPESASAYGTGTIDERGVPIALPPTGYETPGPATYDPDTGRFDVVVDLAGIAWWQKPGHRIFLQVSVGSAFFADPLVRPASEVMVDRVEVELPTDTPVQATKPLQPTRWVDYTCGDI